jgi:hypothetical protein
MIIIEQMKVLEISPGSALVEKNTKKRKRENTGGTVRVQERITTRSRMQAKNSKEDQPTINDNE